MSNNFFKMIALGELKLLRCLPECFMVIEIPIAIGMYRKPIFLVCWNYFFQKYLSDTIGRNNNKFIQ